jgi:WD40 repeat protein
VCQEGPEWMANVVLEALRAKLARREGAVFQSELLGRKALEDRVGLGVRWEEYKEGGELRLGGHGDALREIVACGKWICIGHLAIEVLSRASKERVRSFKAIYAEFEPNEYTPNFVTALAAWESRLISGHKNGEVRVWNMATGECCQVRKGRYDDFPVAALAVCGSRLASGSDDGSIRVWAMVAGAPWACERSLLVHPEEHDVRSLAGWPDKVASGSSDGKIRVWDLGTGALDATLAGHEGGVNALVVHGDRLLSASDDGTIRAWALQTWALLQTVEACGRGTYPCCLAVSGSKLVCGSCLDSNERYPWDYDDGFADIASAEVRVWGLAELDLQQTLRQPADVNTLVAVDGEVWGCVGDELVVWGRRQ